MPKHSSHETRISDASTFDEICINCGATDITAGGWGQLEYPCSRATIDMKGQTCERCKKDVYAERSQHDDMQGMVTCSCGHRVASRKTNESIEEPVKTLHETELEKLKRENEIFKRAFHYIQLHAAVTMNHERVMVMINAICDWSYSHRCGNGENSEERQNELIENSFNKIEKIVNRELS